MSIQFELPASQPLSPEQQLAQDIALVLRGAIEQYHKGEIGEAQALFEAILEAMPTHPDANYNLGVVKVQTGHPTEALPHFEVALGSNPANGHYWVSYINALFESGQTAAAWTAVELAQQRGVQGPALDALIHQLAQPEKRLGVKTNAAPNASRDVNLSIAEKVEEAPEEPTKNTAVPLKSVQHRQAPAAEIQKQNALLYKRQFKEAIALARKLTVRYPKDIQSWRALAVSLHKNSQFSEVIQAARQGVELDPGDVICRLLCADTLRHAGALQEAESQSRELLAVAPDHPEAHRILGITLIALGRRAEAIASCMRAAELAPRSAAVHSSLGNVYLGIGAIAEAENALRTALEIEPTDVNSRTNLLFCLAHSSTIDKAALFKEHRLFGELHDVPAVVASRRYTNARDPERKLRIGFVSGDFCNHAAAYYLLPVVQQLSQHPDLSLHFYYTFGLNDHFTEKLRSQADSWHSVANLSDAALIKKISDDGIDIVIDLSGHTAHSRIVALAHKPAPIQVSWLGYPATTGMTAFDYYLSDSHTTPVEQFADQFVEKLALLPAIAPYMPPPACPPVNALPALHKGYVTYGSFNRLNKLSQDVIALWSVILRAEPTSRMVIGSISSKLDEPTYLEWFAAEGIAADRLTFCPRGSIPIYLQQHHLVDLCLDTFPYTGSTTTLNALWMGVPTITMPGTSMSSRGGACWLEHVELEQFIVRDKEEFVSKSIEFTRDLDALNEIRIGLRERCANSVPFQPEKVAGGLSLALRTMWKRWCAGETPTVFEATLPADWCPPPTALVADAAV